MIIEFHYVIYPGSEKLDLGPKRPAVLAQSEAQARHMITFWGEYGYYEKLPEPVRMQYNFLCSTGGAFGPCQDQRDCERIAKELQPWHWPVIECPEHPTITDVKVWQPHLALLRAGWDIRIMPKFGREPFPGTKRATIA